MFSRIIKKNQPVAEATAELQPETDSQAAWEDKLKAATGNDTELLALAIEAPSIDHKLACVQALASEEALKAAEREFRKRDRRAHSLAKQRYETMVKRRETHARVAELIQAAAALVDAPMIPANRLIELNQAWKLLPDELIEEQEKNRFAKLQSDLAELMRERSERNRAVSRWSSTASKALEELNLAHAGVVAAGMGPQELATLHAAASEKARAALAEMPASVPESGDDGVAALGGAIRSALQDSAPIESRLAMLCELQASQSAALKDEEASQAAAAAKAEAIERWQGLPPITDARIEKALNARFDDWLHDQDTARRKLQKQNNQIASEKNKAARQANIQALKATADAIEAALAGGHLAEAAKQLTALQTASAKGGTGAEFQSRIGALQSEFARLKGWQQWGGGRVRDDLVAEAEALAASTVAPEGSPPVKLQIKQLEKSVDQLRARWKELDRLGGATSKTLWQRFEAALKTAYLPVAAHLAKLAEVRKENLAARRKLLDALDALNITADGEKAPDWKEIQRALVHFQTEWRKLGPIEHTVPHKSQAALLERMKASVARIEEPLREVHVGAQAEREQLIVRAKALSQGVQGRDMMAKLRELQSQWQSHAKSKPLPRKIENALWAEFKASTDALMSQREAVMSARDAEFKANQAAREALIAQLGALNQDTPPADIKRLLANVDAEWHKAGEAPRNQAAGLESRYRAARAQAQQYIAGSAHRAWQLACDALLAKVALCEELESGSASPDIETRWKEQPTLPARWEQALQARFSSIGKETGKGEALDQLLLQLEGSLEIPSPAAFQGARQTLKLLAMKDAMEGRRRATTGWLEIEKMTADAISHTHLSPDQRSRLQSIVAALRRSGPGKSSREA